MLTPCADLNRLLSIEVLPGEFLGRLSRSGHLESH